MNRNLLWAFGLIFLASCQQPKSRVVSVEPAPQSAIAVDLEVISITFDRAMDPNTITETTFVVSGSESGSITGVVSYDAVNNIAQFRPSDRFIFGETVTVLLKSDIKSVGSKSLRRYITSFVVEAAPSFNLESANPSFEQVAVDRLTEVALTYTSPFNPFTASASVLRVTGDRAGSRTITFNNLFSGSETLRASLDRALLPGERVMVSINGLSSLTGITALTSSYFFSATNNGGDWPAASLSTGAGATGTTLLFVDVDRDGADEWVVVEPDGMVSTFDHNGVSVDSIDVLDVGENVIDAVAGDFNEDGRVDIVCLGAGGNNIYLLRGVGTNSALFGAPTTLVTGLNAASLSVSHLDVNGTHDLIVRGTGVNGARILFGGANNPLTTGLNISDLASTTEIVAGDFDGDFRVDLAGTLSNGSLVVFYNNGDNTFTRSAPLTTANTPVALRVGNFDGDNFLDLLAISASGQSSVLFLSDGNDQFTAATVAAGVASASSAVVDFDGDGALDLLTPVVGTVGVNLHSGNGDGTFAVAQLQITTNTVAALSLGDIDGDGALDVGQSLAGSLGWEVGLSNSNDVSTFGNRMKLADITAAVGASGVPFEVSADHDDALSGFTVSLSYDPALVTVDQLSSVGTDAGLLGVEFEIPSVDNVNGVAVLGAIFDFGPPFDNQQLNPGSNHTLAIGTLTLNSAMTAGVVDFGLANGLGSPPKDNNFTVGGFSVLPSLVNGTLTATASNNTTPTFLRGDVNGDGNVNIADGTALSSFLFTNGSPPPCEDAADVNDDGALTIIDSTMLNAFLFSGGTAPPAPFPSAGVDPTNDSLSCPGSGS